MISKQELDFSIILQLSFRIIHLSLSMQEQSDRFQPLEFDDLQVSSCLKGYLYSIHRILSHRYILA